MKKDFPFVAAFVIALLLHMLAGLGMKYGKLFASPAPPPSNAPVTLQFVEVPPNATTIPQAPNTNKLSDANRKAGPLTPNGPKRTVVQQPIMRPPGPPAGEKQRQPSPANSQAPAPKQAQAEPNPPLPDQTVGIAQPSKEQLAQSLGDLDRYIKGGNGSTGQGTPGGEGGEGNLPSGDPGSGVFFDTQGFDLGPWANRAVEIVRSNWIIPVAAELGMKGVVGISFKVDRLGKITDIKIVSQSGVPSFDQAAARALQSSSPLPPLPLDFPRDILPGVFRFYYNMPVPDK